MVPYILAQNPDMNASDAIRLSCAMTKGYKWDLFVLDLSFIGWYFLGAMAFGIGTLFVNPYKDATVAQMYIELRDLAVHNRVAVPENFGMASFAPEAYPTGTQTQNIPAEDDILDYRDKPFNK